MREERSITARDGVELSLTVWRPPGEVRFVVMITHGAADHALRYSELAEHLNAAGGLCFGIDLRGQGASGGPRGHVERFEDYAEDLLTAARAFAEELPSAQRPASLPWFMFGHSMGGLVVLVYLLDHERVLPLRGAVISAPFLKLAMPVPAIKRLAARVGDVIAPRLPFPTGIDSDACLRDPERRREYAADPRRHDVVTPRWSKALERAQARVEAEVARVELPMLWYAGTADALVDHRTTERVYRSQVEGDARDRELRLFEGFLHEPHNELPADRARVLDLVRDWMLARLVPRT